MRIGSKIFFLFLFTTTINFVNAQQQIFKNYTINDGLISNEIRRVFQDSKGFLWIGTLEGLSKYDGNTFSNFSAANGLSHNMVNDIYENGDNRLYILLNDGSIDEIENNKIIRGKNKSTIVVNRIFNTPWRQAIALTDNNGFRKFKDGQLIQLSAPISDTSFGVTDNFFFKVFNKDYQLISQLKLSNGLYSEIKCFKGFKGRVWIATGRGVKLIEPLNSSNKLVLNDSLPKAFYFLNQYVVNDIFEDEEQNIWFATSAGIVKINVDSTYQIFTVKDGLTSNIINTIFQDKEKNMWFGTALGLSKLVIKSGISLYPIEDGIFSNDNQYLMYPFKKGHFLVGTIHGTKDFDKEKGIYSDAFKVNDDIFYKPVENTDPLLITGVNKSVILDSHLMQIHTIVALSFPFKTRIKLSDHSGNSFATHINSLFFNSQNGFQKIIDERITYLLIDKNNYLWAGTWQHGLFRFRYEVINKKIEILETKHFLRSVNIRTLFEDSLGNIWVGSRYSGIFRLSKNEKDRFTILNLNQASGLTSNFIKDIKEDGEGNLWIAFFQGLDKLIPNNNSYSIFNFSRVNNYYVSILGIEIGDPNTLWLATREGIVKIKDGQLNKLPPFPVFITKIYSSDTTYPLQAKLKFNYRQKDIVFEFSSPSYINEKQIFYSYLLEGNNGMSWSKASNQHTVSFAGLAPGNYQFQVKSLGWNGIWGIPSFVDFVITPPFWKTWWFFSVLLLIAGGLIYLFIKWRIKNIKAVEAEKLKVQELNSEQFKNELELEQVINYFSNSLIDKIAVDDVLWDVAKNLIGKLGFVDCMIYLWNDDKTRMVQKAGFGPKGTLEEINKQYFEVQPGQGIVGHVMQTREPIIISDTSNDMRYRVDEMIRSSEICLFQ